MKKLFLLLFLIISLNIKAQYIVNYASNINQNETDGIYYNLPRNVIRLDFTVESVHEIKGKYSNFAKELLETNNYIKEDDVKYYIKDVTVDVLTEADSEMIFYISTDEKSKDNIELNMRFTSEGNIQSFGIKDDRRDLDSENVSFENELAQQNTNSYFIYLPLRDDEEDDDVEDEENLEAEVKTNDKMSEEEIAQSIVEEIKKIRLAYFDLISGYQEIDYGNTMNVMLEELKKMENEYLALFVGRVEKNDIVKTFYIIPEEGTNNYSVAKFSDKEGFNSKTGDNVKIVLQEMSSSNVKGISEDVIKNTTYNNKMVYREPAYVNMKLMKGDEILIDNRIQISQLGDFILLPINKMKLEFDNVSGRLISVDKE